MFIFATHRAIRRFSADPSAPHPRTLAVTATYPVDDGPDVLAFDPGWHRLYVASESGIVSIFDERGPELQPVGEYRAPHAHSVAVDPRTHRVYLPLENVDGKPVLRILETAGDS